MACVDLFNISIQHEYPLLMVTIPGPDHTILFHEVCISPTGKFPIKLLFNSYKIIVYIVRQLTHSNVMRKSCE